MNNNQTTHAEYPAHKKLADKHQFDIDYAVKYGCKPPTVKPLLAEYWHLQARLKHASQLKKAVERALKKMRMGWISDKEMSHLELALANYQANKEQS